MARKRSTTKKKSSQRSTGKKKTAGRATSDWRKLGRSQLSRSHIETLKRAWKKKQLVLFLGAGVSVPYGVPNWRDLVLDMLITDRQFNRYWQEYRTALADWMTDHHRFELTTIARIVKKKVCQRSDGGVQEFAKLVRQRLYDLWNTDQEYQSVKNSQQRDTTLAHLARLLAKVGRRAEGCATIVTFNFDDFLEQELDRAKVPYHHIGKSGTVGEGLGIIHPHGFLPQSGKISDPELVFAEDEYHRLSMSMFHWAVTEILTRLRRHTCLFVGLSMSDPNLRRLLDATHDPTIGRHRFVVYREMESPVGAEMSKACQQIESAAQQMREKTEDWEHEKGQKNVARAVQRVTESAAAFQADLFEDMGVGTLPIRDHADIPKLLKAIAGHTRN